MREPRHLQIIYALIRRQIRSFVFRFYELEALLQVVHPRRVYNSVMLQSPHDDARVDAYLVREVSHCKFGAQIL